MKLFGYTLDKNGNPVAGVTVEVKDEQFQTLYSVQSGGLGYYEIDAEQARYPYVVAVKDYGVKNLEYWCQNVDLRQDLRLDARFDTLEIYGLHPFFVKGSVNAPMVYFRPMSLEKFQAGEADIAPDIRQIRVTIDDQNANILIVNQVKESIGNGELTAYLIQIENPNTVRQWKRLDLEIWDQDGHYGAATIFGS